MKMITLFNVCIIVVASSVLREFKKTFASQIINPCDLQIKEKIGEGEYLQLHR